MANVLVWRDGNVVEEVVEEPRVTVSARAQALGLFSLDDLKLEVLRQRPIWWAGSAFHCPLCNVDFLTAQRAAEHVVLEQHPVLRMD